MDMHPKATGHPAGRLRRGAGVIFIVAFAATLASCAAPAPSDSQAADQQPQDLVFPPPPETPRFFFERTILGSADITVEDGESKWRRILTGEVDASTSFSKPFDVEACQGRIYVSDTVRRSVHILNVPTGEYREVGLDEPGVLRKPLGMAVDSDCNVYVVDGTLKRVVVYDQDGVYLSAFGGRDKFERPTHVDVDADARYAYVVDTGGVSTEDHRIRVFDIATGELEFDIGRRGDGPGQFNLPKDIAIGPDGLLYVVDSSNFRIQVFEADGTYVHAFGSIGVQPGQFSRPKSVDTDPDGNVYVTDAAFGNFQIFNPAGQLLLFVGSRSTTAGAAKYMLPAGIGIDEDGRVYMVDQFFRKVDVYRPAAIGPRDGYMGARAAGN
jgi:DNA-binding beta-propeller fold protein YncE